MRNKSVFATLISHYERMVKNLECISTYLRVREEGSWGRYGKKR
jgi:hypothetical protein